MRNSSNGIYYIIAASRSRCMPSLPSPLLNKEPRTQIPICSSVWFKPCARLSRNKAKSLKPSLTLAYLFVCPRAGKKLLPLFFFTPPPPLPPSPPPSHSGVDSFEGRCVIQMKYVSPSVNFLLWELFEKFSESRVFSREETSRARKCRSRCYSLWPEILKSCQSYCLNRTYGKKNIIISLSGFIWRARICL